MSIKKSYTLQTGWNMRIKEKQNCKKNYMEKLVCTPPIQDTLENFCVVDYYVNKSHIFLKNSRGK